MFEVRLSAQAMKFLERCDGELHERLQKRLLQLAADPVARNAQLVQGRAERTFRVRVGDYRILYCVFFSESIVTVTTIDKRGRVYE